MCPQPVRLVVMRTRLKAHQPYRYFMVYTTDLTLAVSTIVRYYKWRWGLETAFRDTKENLGFDHYQVHAEQSIERSVLLAFVAASLTRLVALPAFQKAHEQAIPALGPALEKMNIHWYHPTRWTVGLILRYIRWHHQRPAILPCFSTQENTDKQRPILSQPVSPDQWSKL